MEIQNRDPRASADPEYRWDATGSRAHWLEPAPTKADAEARAASCIRFPGDAAKVYLGRLVVAYHWFGPKGPDRVGIA